MLAAIAGPDILIVIATVLVLFGGTQIPKLARSLGSASSEFKRGQEQGELLKTLVTADTQREVSAPRAITTTGTREQRVATDPETVTQSPGATRSIATPRGLS
jgi:sec-independent protein translocase protein TatA